MGVNSPLRIALGSTTSALAADVSYSTGSNLMLSVTRLAPPSGNMVALLVGNVTFFGLL